MNERYLVVHSHTVKEVIDRYENTIKWLKYYMEKTNNKVIPAKTKEEADLWFDCINMPCEAHSKFIYDIASNTIIRREFYV